MSRTILFVVSGVAALGCLVLVTGQVGGALPPARDLALAAFLGGLVSYRRGAREGQALITQAHMILSVAACLMMLIIGSQLARAFGLMGAASIVRYRYSLSSPREASSLIVALGLGMACGTSLYALAFVGAALSLVVLNLPELLPSAASGSLFREQSLHAVTLVTDDLDTTLSRLEEVLGRRGITLRLTAYRRAGRAESARCEAEIELPPDVRQSELGRELMGSEVTELRWKRKKRSAA
jgi:uncharacterized membrane protein YhiD involved in acid resistance